MNNDPVFIVGTERSGSNLLRLILDAHSRISVPHPPHICRYFRPLESTYSGLDDDDNFAHLVSDVLRLLRVHIHPWDCPIDGDRILEEARPRSVLGVMAALYDQYRVCKGKDRWGCKSTFMINHTDEVLDHFPNALFIWLVRDPRDVAVSSARSVFSPFHPHFVSVLWTEQQRLGQDLMERLGSQQVHLLHYEDLLADPEVIVSQLCDFLEEEFEPAMLRFFETEEARRSALLSESWRNSNKPIIRGNSGKYREQMKVAEIRRVEAVTGALMDALRYARDFPHVERLNPNAFEVARFGLTDARMRLQVEWRSLRKDTNHWRRWARGITVVLLGLKQRLATRPYVPRPPRRTHRSPPPRPVQPWRNPSAQTRPVGMTTKRARSE